MVVLKNLSIEKKLIIVYMSITGVVLALAFSIISNINFSSSKENVITGLNVVAEIVAASSATSLAFSDEASASAYLKMLKSQSSIVYACIRTAENTEFVELSFRDSGTYNCDEFHKEKGTKIKEDYLDVYKPIMLEGHVVGSLQIKSSLKDLTDRMIKSAKLSLLIFVGLMLPTVYISKKILSYITEPIKNLKEITKTVTKSKDYSLRMTKESDDEVGVLIGAFNNMLDQIQSRDEDLVKEKEKAEASAITAKEYALETEKINSHLESEIKERSRIEHELNELNETLEEKVNERTSELKELNEKIGDVARSAGMAEVASGVLHNVGNVLNSVNVSASVIREKVRGTKAGNLSKVAEMLERNESDIARFISKDESGKQIPKFLSLLAEQLNLEKKSMYGELDELVNNIDHIKNVISMQQSYAGSYGVKEKVMLPDLIEDALRMNVQGMGRHGVKVLKSYKEISSLYVDKHKVLQILINLISNAKHAIIESQNKVKNLTISLSKDGDMALLEVNDTGIGIGEEDIKHLFEYGFKKRRDGHGFGLHHSAIVANELGGKISVRSDGLGKGASFLLWLPYGDNSSAWLNDEEK